MMMLLGILAAAGASAATWFAICLLLAPLMVLAAWTSHLRQRRIIARADAAPATPVTAERELDHLPLAA